MEAPLPDARWLESRLAPAGLDDSGRCTLDLGGRRLVLGFDADLRPFVLGDDGALHRRLPRPRASDDPQAVARARAQWTNARVVVQRTGRELARGLEAALVSQRRWAPASWRLLAAHPLLGGMMRSLLWGDFGEDGALTACFRVDEGGALVDREGSPFTLRDRPGLVHPAALSEAAVTRWGEVFSEHQLIQPFPQLFDRARRLERDGGIVPELLGQTVQSAQIRRLWRRGWRRGQVEAGGLYQAAIRSTSAGPFCVRFKPGINNGEFQDTIFFDRHELVEVGGLALGEVPAVELSELLLDLEQLLRE